MSDAPSSPRSQPAASPTPAAWAALALLLVLLLIVVVSVIAATTLPGAADRYLPEKVAANIALFTANATGQLLFGSAIIALAATLGRYVGTDGLVAWLAMVGGIVGGAAFIAAGAIEQETVFNSVFVGSKEAGQLAAASGSHDLTALNMAIGNTAGGMRSAGSYAFGVAWIGWSIVGARARRLPRWLAAVGVIAGVGWALTNWIGPIAGPVAFVGSLIWLPGLAIVLFRTSRRPQPQESR